MRTKRIAGFTLIEVLVALLIFGLVAATVLKSTSSSVQRHESLEERSLAAWIAANAITELRLQSRLSPGRRGEDLTFAGRQWKVVREVIATPNPWVKEIRITVQRVEEGLEPRQVAVVTGYGGTH
ncbi:type II secretion system minor pseudopilin GspI [Hahella sp. SMD15-11]|uniref:Type II secretion system protein I n=1 Tax=Thermohahella caldifontis TaxID=3142973 RepID=A0AB39UYK5_9GAMM